MNYCLLCFHPFPNRITIGDKVLNVSKRKYCISCSPYNAHNTRPLPHLDATKNGKTCPLCMQFKLPSDYYKRYGKQEGDLSPYCKTCTNEASLKRQRELKIKAVQYKGGCCQICGYSKSFAALHFHHLGQAKKSFNICKHKKMSFVKLKEELDKCMLLCNRCHREVSGGFRTLEGKLLMLSKSICESTERCRQFKQRAIEYKGGKCVCCGYSDFFGAMDFHHRNPEDKDFSLSTCKTSVFEVAKKELDKCELVCCRCHVEVENNELVLPVGIEPTSDPSEGSILSIERWKH
jgi:hypothetical protein